MNSNPSLEYIKNRLSLRKPQIDSIEILDNLVDDILSDIPNSQKIKIIKSKFEWFKDFDREFPSLCFSLATGVGKTRLMGAFVAYLYITKNVKNFMIIAPNITIYNKLKKDFSDNTSGKYVFKGLKEFVQTPPKIVTGENYKEQGKQSLWESDITINIFNIDKINKDEQSIKSLSEYLGQSYYDFLCEMDNLVVLMDESHHYRAARGMKVLNELKPVLGLELTATPQVERNGRTVRFNNIVYDYPLKNALLDGYVKDPFVATKKDFNPSNFNEEELDHIKILDGIRIHQNTKVSLEEYSKENNTPLVRPFAMIICKSIEHGEQVLEYLKSNDFFDGYYKDKVLFINSKEGKTEKDENVEKLLLLEHPLNKIEIVVHVNMLKEGWDVTNLYTIIPLRRSASQTLTEQTMGRGLRLPYGKRVGNDIVDGLTIVSHDKYQEIVNEAHKEDSIFNASNIKYVEDMDLKEKEVIASIPVWQVEYDEKIKNENKEEQKIELSIKKQVENIISNSKKIDSDKFKEIEIKEKVLDGVNTQLKLDLNLDDIKETYDEIIDENIDNMIENYYKNSINIPYVSTSRQNSIKQEYKDFDFDYEKIKNYRPLAESMIIQHLDDGETFEISFNNTKSIYSNPKELLFEKILSSPSIEYEKCADILNDKIDGYLKILGEKFDTDEIINIVFNYSNYIVKEFTNQINSNMVIIDDSFEEFIVMEHSKILSGNYTKYKIDNILKYTDVINKSDVPKKVFTGFKKTYHNIYKFDSSTEKDFSVILENSSSVKKWLRPAPNQFNIYWNKEHKYEPDFVVETEENIYLVEIKAENQASQEEVQLKKKAAEEYCNIVNDYGKTHNIKKWIYLIIEDSNVKTNYSFDRYIEVE